MNPKKKKKYDVRSITPFCWYRYIPSISGILPFSRNFDRNQRRLFFSAFYLPFIQGQQNR